MGMYVFCQPSSDMRVWGWESSVSTWGAFMMDLDKWRPLYQELNHLYNLDSQNATIPAEAIPGIHDALIAVRPVLYPVSDGGFREIWMDRLIKCCKVAAANGIGLDSWW